MEHEMPAPKKTPRPKANPKMDPMEADRSRGMTNRELLNYNRAMSRMGKKGTTMKDGGKVKKMAMGGTIRGCGAATKGTKYNRAG
jgi:hypothetical protein